MIFKGQHVVVAMPAGDAESRPTHQHAWAGYIPSVDGITEGYITELRCPHITHRGKPGKQCRPGIFRSDESFSRYRNRQNLVAEFRIHGQMSVCINKSRKYGRAWQVNAYCVCW